ncbi:MAG TPA: cytochrome P450 [Candidatus Sulfotelmatobacter sp.]|nr:cytochrome P450 [Candidatus Sulfotelmatobacter sp.]
MLLDWMGEQFARFGDIFSATAFGTAIYAINDPAYAEHVLRRNWQNYRKGTAIKRIRLLLGNGLMASEGTFWKAQRRMIQPAFHRAAMAALIPLMTAASDRLLDGWMRAARAHRSVNVTRDISLMVLETVLLAIFGEDYDELAPRFRMLSEEAARDLRFAQDFRSLGTVVTNLAARRRARGIDAADILGLLMKASDAQDGRPMTAVQLTSEVLTLIVAGHETTASTLNWLWFLLAQHPGAERRLEREARHWPADGISTLDDLRGFPYSRQVIEETLRLYPAGWLMTRKALADDRLGDYFVPAGTEIYISPYFIQRHPGLWKNPDCFDPGRFDPGRAEHRPELAMMPFSAGPRNCIGEHFARVEMQIHLITVARQLHLRYDYIQMPELDIGVNLRSRHDFVMMPEAAA